MAYSYVVVREWMHDNGTVLVDIDARGGTRRERGAAIGAAARKRPGLVRRRVSYSETYGFMPATFARYEDSRRWACPGCGVTARPAPAGWWHDDDGSPLCPDPRPESRSPVEPVRV